MRMRFRFRAAPSLGFTCSCQRHISVSLERGRETVIHELPWCERFAALMARVEGEPEVDLHTALMDPMGGQTTIIADADSVADLHAPVKSGRS